MWTWARTQLKQRTQTFTLARCCFVPSLVKCILNFYWQTTFRPTKIVRHIANVREYQVIKSLKPHKHSLSSQLQHVLFDWLSLLRCCFKTRIQKANDDERTNNKNINNVVWWGRSFQVSFFLLFFCSAGRTEETAAAKYGKKTRNDERINTIRRYDRQEKKKKSQESKIKKKS